MVDKAFSTLVPSISQSVPGCPQPLILKYIRDAAIRACERTLFWRWVQPTYSLTPGVFEYGYNKPDNTDVHIVFAAIMNGTPLERLILEDAITKYPQWADAYSGLDPDTMWSSDASSVFDANEFNVAAFNSGNTFVVPDTAYADGSEPRSVTQINPDKYLVLPLPDNKKPYVMRMFYALKPKRTATSMDSVVMDELEDMIVHGALQNLLVMPNVAWKDRELATYHAKQFLYYTSDRRARSNFSNVRGNLAVVGPKFA